MNMCVCVLLSLLDCREVWYICETLSLYIHTLILYYFFLFGGRGECPTPTRAHKPTNLNLENICRYTVMTRYECIPYVSQNTSYNTYAFLGEARTIYFVFIPSTACWNLNTVHPQGTYGLPYAFHDSRRPFKTP